MSGAPDSLPMTAAEVAKALGHTVGWFHANYRRLVERDGMPPAVSSVGRKRFNRARMLVWLDPATRLDRQQAAQAEADAAASERCRAAYSP